MAIDDFDIPGLAAYLHLDPAKVTKLAERGKLPGRRVGGEWKFAQAEIHHWLEDQIGASDEQELVRVEGFLESAASADEDMLSLGEMLPVEAIAIPLAARTRNSVITSMVELAARTGWLWDAAKMIEAVRGREEMHPTALEIGAALMHPRRPMPNILGQAFLALGRTDAGIPFGGSRGRLTDVFFLICSIDDRGHLRTLARLSRLISNPDFLDELRAAPDAPAARDVIIRHEKNLPG